MKRKLVIWLLVSLMILGSCGRNTGDAVSDSEKESVKVNNMSKEVNDFEWGIEIIKDALSECIEFIEQQEGFIE